MKISDRELFRSILLEKRKYVFETIQRLKEISQINEEKTDFVGKYNADLTDQASDSIGREESFLLISRELQYLNRIDRALEAMENGKYGLCKICNQEISHERLLAVPTADTCVSCKTSEKLTFFLN